MNQRKHIKKLLRWTVAQKKGQLNWLRVLWEFLCFSSLLIFAVGLIASICFVVFWSVEPVDMRGGQAFFEYARYVSVFIAFLIVVVFFAGKDLFATDLNDTQKQESRKPRSGWVKNRGIRPECPLVNIQLSSGEVVWRVEPKKLDWSVARRNPIKEYIRAGGKKYF